MMGISGQWPVVEPLSQNFLFVLRRQSADAMRPDPIELRHVVGNSPPWWAPAGALAQPRKNRGIAGERAITAEPGTLTERTRSRDRRSTKGVGLNVWAWARAASGGRWRAPRA